MINYDTATTDQDLRYILDLQDSNLPANLSAQEARSEGFLTVRHSFDLLKRMNTPYPHIVARDGVKVIGYALVMLRSFATEIPVLAPMFDRINGIKYNGSELGGTRYFIMGQVCIGKPYRGQGVFTGLYAEMKKRMAKDFDFIITEVATRNTRSMRAHQKLGFETILEYRDGEEWAVVLLRF